MNVPNLDSWLEISQSISIGQLENDFSGIVKDQGELIPILTKETQVSSGVFIEYNGMRTTYLGAFTHHEEEFLKSIYSQFNKKIELRIMHIIHTTDDNGLINGADIHLFSGIHDFHIAFVIQKISWRES